jgi:hypothetical protein
VAVISIRNWDKYQHYKTGKNALKPPWVKLYRDLLTEPWFAGLPGYVKWQAVGLLLLAAECQNRIAYDERFLIERLHVRPEFGEELAIDVLQEVGWVRVSGRPRQQSRIESRTARDFDTISPLIRPRLSDELRVSGESDEDADPGVAPVSSDPRISQDPRMILESSTLLSRSRIEGSEEEVEGERGGEEREESGRLFVGAALDTPEAEALLVLADYWSFSIADRDWRWFESFCRTWDEAGLDVSTEILAATTRRGEVPKSWRRALTNWLRKALEIQDRDGRRVDAEAVASSRGWSGELPDGVSPDEAQRAWSWFRSSPGGAAYQGGYDARQTMNVVRAYREAVGGGSE